MANYKVVDADRLDADLASVADSIRAKAGTTDQMAFPDGFKSVVAGIQTGGAVELPDAEDASFGAESVSYEDGAVFGAHKGTINQNGEKGYEFTANEDCMLYGFRHIGGSDVNYTLNLWEQKSGTIIAQYNNAKANTNWNQFLLDSPVKLVAGETYAVTQSGFPIYRTNSWTAASKRITKTRYCESYTNGTCPTITLTVVNPVTMVDILVGDLPSVSATEYKIQTTTVNAISEQVQRIIGTTDKLTPAQIITSLQGIASTA